MALARKNPTGNKARDVANKVFLEAEQRALDYLRAKGWHVADNRKARTFYDFVVNHAWTLDVKADQYAIETQRVAFEVAIDEYAEVEDEYGSSKVLQATRAGWGAHHGLNYVAFVFVNEGEEWPILILHRAKTLEALNEHLEKGLAGNEVTRFGKQDGEYRRAVGYLLDVEWLRRNGCVMEEGVCGSETMPLS